MVVSNQLHSLIARQCSRTRRSGLEGAFKETNKWKGACHKWFRTRAQAEAFVRDWEHSLADVCRIVALQKLESGLRPGSMELEDLAISLRFGDDCKVVY